MYISLTYVISLSIRIYCIYFQLNYIIASDIRNSLWDLAVILNAILQGGSEGRNM